MAAVMDVDEASASELIRIPLIHDIDLDKN